MDLIRQYDRIGEEYLDKQKTHYSENPDWPRTFLYKQVSLVNAQNILDLGCGNATDILHYESIGLECHGVDTSEVMVAEAKKQVSQPGNIHLADLRELPYPDNTFDLVVSRYGFHYHENLDLGYEEIHRVLKESGNLILIVPNPIHDAIKMNKPYGGSFIVEAELYAGTITVQYPSHTLMDYFSDAFSDLFTLEHLDEALRMQVDEKHRGVPSTLGIVAQKRTA